MGPVSKLVALRNAWFAFGGLLRGGGLDLARLALVTRSGYVHVRTLRVLRDPDVRRHVLRTA